MAGPSPATAKGLRATPSNSDHKHVHKVKPPIQHPPPAPPQRATRSYHHPRQSQSDAAQCKHTHPPSPIIYSTPLKKPLPTAYKTSYHKLARPGLSFGKRTHSKGRKIPRTNKFKVWSSIVKPSRRATSVCYSTTHATHAITMQQKREQIIKTVFDVSH